MRIAHFGTFDVENYGDLLFPLILEKRLADICDEFVHVSPVGGPPVWDDCVSSVPFDGVMRDSSNIDGAVIGGGHIVRASPTPMKLYSTGALSSSFAYPGLWLGAGYVAASSNIPLCWNAPGVTEPSSQISAQLLRWTASVSDYISLRDREGLRLLNESGIEQPTRVVPDTALEVSHLWNERELSEAFEAAFSQRGREVPERTLVFHLTSRWATEEVDVLAARLDRICVKRNATAILVAIGPCHGDSALQRRVAEKMSTDPLLIEYPQSLREVAACIAYSDAYIGSSMHGMITACSFGKRGMLVASRDIAKFAGFLEQFHLSRWQSESWEEAEERVTELFSTPKSAWERVPEAAAPILDEHWTTIRSLLQSRKGASETSGTVAGKRPMIEDLHSIGRGYFGEGEIFKGIVADNLINLQRQIPELRQQLNKSQKEKARAEKETQDAKARAVREIQNEKASAQQEIQDVKARAEQEIQDVKEASAQQLAHRDELLNEKTEQVEQLRGWMESVDELVPALLGSRQWRAGRLLHEAYRRVRRRPRVPTAATHLVSMLQQYRSWKQGASAKPVKIPESSLEARARRLLELTESNRSIPGNIRSASSRAVASGRRRARQEYKRLRPRIEEDALAERIRGKLGPAPQLESWPPVSVIVLNRDGLSYLKKLFSGLKERTDYPAESIEVLVVDNASTDGSVEFVRTFEAPFAVRVIENSENASFSEGNNQGAELAFGGLLLFANNDIEPFEPGWLEEMVALRGERDAAAVGARLLYRGVTEHEVSSGYAVQHRGVGFRREGGEEWHRNLGMGEDALDGRLGVDEERPAVTAACMLVERDAFESVGGFTLGYRYGSEDVDLCLKLLSEDHSVVSSGRAVLFHDESPSQKAAGREFMRINRTGNRKMFWERWGPELHRRCRLDRLSGGGFWSAEGTPHIALTVTSKDQRAGYGDWHTAHEMGGALEDLGWRVSYVERKGDRWYSLPDDLDYLMVLIDLYDIPRVPEGVMTVAWIRNWTERWIEHPWFGEYDVVLASSGISREIIESKSAKKVDALFPIATNPKRFSPTVTEPSYEADYVFTGNFWGDLRGIVDSLEVSERETFRIYGKGWENVPQVARYAGGTLPYDEMPKVYSSSKLVIDDTASPTLPYGAINSRVFDALATGTPVITNCEAGARELFDEDFPTYTGRRELREQLDQLLNDEARRKELGERYKNMVLSEHTYEKRAGQLVEILRGKFEAPSFCIKIGPPNRKEARSWGDTHYARAMRRQLEAAGYPCAIQTLDEWDSLAGMSHDVAIHLKGLTPYTTKPGQLNVLWNISHPEKLTPGECDRYDAVFVASERWAGMLEGQTETPVYPLQQATDPHVFYPDSDPDYEHDLVFVGNSRRVERRILRDLLPTDRDLAVWGGDWKGLIDDKYVVGEYLPNEEVRKAYSSAAIVLNDHWDDMREHGFVSNRIYDALACGALVISDHIEELEERFGDAVVTYEDAGQLKELVDYYLDHPEERAQRGELGRRLVLEQHTFEHRIKELLNGLREQREGSALPMKTAGRVPDGTLWR